MSTLTFQEALELIESLPSEERQSLIDLARRRLVEERREEIAKATAEAREDYARGEVKHGTVEDLLGDLHK